MSNSSAPKTFGDLQPSKYPGERLGLPESGQRSVARIGRRVLAIFFDWATAMVIAGLFFPGKYVSLATLAIFALMQIIFIPTIGGSIGHWLFGMRVVPLVGGWIGLWRPLVRTLLLCVVVPVLVWDSDQRAFHDKIAGTVLVRA